MHSVGKLDIEKYKCVTSDIQTDEVIITDERIQHIKDRHPKDFENFVEYISEVIAEPDYIIEDERPFTAMVLKEFYEPEKKEFVRLSLRLITSVDSNKYKNSIITFMKIREKEYKRLLKNKKILYKKE